MRLRCKNRQDFFSMLGIMGCLGATIVMIYSLVMIYFFGFVITVSYEIYVELPLLVLCVYLSFRSIYNISKIKIGDK